MANILVVDDQATNLRVLSDLLSDAHQVLVARDGEKALRLAREQPSPDLVLLDVVMPGMDGYEVCRRLKADPDTAEIPVIFITARDAPQEEQQGFDLGAVDYITKPFSPQVVLARVRSHLALYGMQRELERQVEERTRELRQAMEEAEVASRAKMQFLATMNHELRTPLNAILGHAQLLETSGLTDDQRESVEAVTKASRVLLGRVEDILDVARADRGSIQLHPQPFRWRECLDEAWRGVAPAAAHKRVVLQVEADAQMPDGLEGDAGLIARVLGYLLDNAVKFSPDGAPVTLAHGLEPHGYELVWRLRVIDRGCGISTDYRATLFEAFSQADASTTRKYEGMGIGLALVRKLVRLLGGEVGVESEPGQGSTFSVSVPVKRLAHPLSPAQPVVPSGEEEASPADGGSPRRPLDREALRPLLQRLRGEIANYNTEALEVVEQCATLLRGTAAEGEIGPVRTALDGYDFDTAGEALETLLGSLDIAL